MGVGLSSAYEPAEVAATVATLLDPKEQARMRQRAAALAPSLSTAGAREWLWRSLALGEAADERFEALFPRKASEALRARGGEEHP
jgi:hypothetical protein